MAKSAASVTAQLEAHRNAGKKHPWPDEIAPPCETTLSIYIKNQGARAYEDWPEFDLVELARMSKMQKMCIDETAKYENEGAIVYGGKTGLVMVENARGRAISTINGNISSIARRLGLTDSVRADRRTSASKTKMQREAEAVATDNDGDEFNRDMLM